MLAGWGWGTAPHLAGILMEPVRVMAGIGMGLKYALHPAITWTGS